MFRIPVIASILICVLVGVRSPQVFAQTKQSTNPAPEAPPKSDLIRLKLADGSYIVVDEAWETPQGFWYRRGGMSHVLPKDRVKAIERSSPATAKEQEEDPEPDPEPVRATPASAAVYDKPAWIYLVGGARVEADSATQSAAGVWYKRGNMSIFLDRSRVDHIELEEVEKSTDSSSQKERG